MGAEDPNMLVAVEFEVFGQVQGMASRSKSRAARLGKYFDHERQKITGCFFTKYCKELAEQLQICGWVKNTKNGTIVGKVQGTKANLDHMIDWLSTKGSPGCKIEKCDLRNWQYLSRLDYNNFGIRF